MGLEMYHGRGTGKAKCKSCGLKINKGASCTYAIGYQTSGTIHRSPALCAKAKALDALEKVIKGERGDNYDG